MIVTTSNFLNVFFSIHGPVFYLPMLKEKNLTNSKGKTTIKKKSVVLTNIFRIFSLVMTSKSAIKTFVAPLIHHI